MQAQNSLLTTASLPRVMLLNIPLPKGDFFFIGISGSVIEEKVKIPVFIFLTWSVSWLSPHRFTQSIFCSHLIRILAVSSPSRLICRLCCLHLHLTCPLTFSLYLYLTCVLAFFSRLTCTLALITSTYGFSSDYFLTSSPDASSVLLTFWLSLDLTYILSSHLITYPAFWLVSV